MQIKQYKINVNILKEGDAVMDIELEIEKRQNEVDYWVNTLRFMPEDTYLGRKCAEFYLKRARRKLLEALEKQNNGNM